MRKRIVDFGMHWSMWMDLKMEQFDKSKLNLSHCSSLTNPPDSKWLKQMIRPVLAKMKQWKGID